MNKELKKRALAQLREWAEAGCADECYSVQTLADKLGCEYKDLYDRDNDSGVLFHLNRDGHINFTMCETCVYPVGLRHCWDY